MKLNIIISIITFFVIAFAFFATEASTEKPYKDISAEDLVEMKKENPSLIIIDSRGGKYFDGELIEGAVHLSVKETNGNTLGKIIPSKDTDIVFYCSNTACRASGLAAYKAAFAGYTSLYKYPEGIEEWKEKGLPIVQKN